MTNTDNAAPAKSSKVAERDWLGADGSVLEYGQYHEVAGIRYTAVETGEIFECAFDDLPTESLRMLAAFGAVTLAGNVRSGVVNAKEPGTESEAIEAIRERFATIASGKWSSGGDGAARGPKYDNTILAAALHAALEAKGAAKGTPDEYFNRLETDKSYRAKVVANVEVKAIYAEMAGKPAADVSTLA